MINIKLFAYLRNLKDKEKFVFEPRRNPIRAQTRTLYSSSSLTSTATFLPSKTLKNLNNYVPSKIYSTNATREPFPFHKSVYFFNIILIKKIKIFVIRLKYLKKINNIV